MAIGDQAGLEAVKLLNKETLPQLRRIANELIDKINGLVVNLANGAVITITISIPGRDKNADPFSSSTFVDTKLPDIRG